MLNGCTCHLHTWGQEDGHDFNHDVARSLLPLRELGGRKLCVTGSRLPGLIMAARERQKIGQLAECSPWWKESETGSHQKLQMQFKLGLQPFALLAIRAERVQKGTHWPTVKSDM